MHICVLVVPTVKQSQYVAGYVVKSCLLNPIVLRKAKIVYNFGLSECSRVKEATVPCYDPIAGTLSHCLHIYTLLPV